MTKHNNKQNNRHRIKNRQDLERQAMTEGLAQIDASRLDLRNMTLDCVTFCHVDFTGANLTGANMSECVFEHCTFDEACLIDTCLCESIFRNCSFSLSRFGATDICYAHMHNCHFAGHSALTLNFLNLSSLEQCHFATDTRTIDFDKAPIVIQGLLNTSISLIGDRLLLGHKTIPLNALPPSLTHYIFGQVLKGEAACALPQNVKSPQMYGE